MEILLFIIAFAFLIVAIGLRFNWSFGKKSFKQLAEYVKNNTDQTILASFLCSNPKAGNVGLFLSKDNVRCGNQDHTVFNIKPDQILRVEYSDGNFFRFITKEKTYKLSYLHEVKEGESILNNVIMPPNLAYTDPSATQKFIGILDTLKIQHVKRPHIKVVFFPYQGSPAVLGFMALIVIAWIIFALANS